MPMQGQRLTKGATALKDKGNNTPKSVLRRRKAAIISSRLATQLQLSTTLRRRHLGLRPLRVALAPLSLQVVGPLAPLVGPQACARTRLQEEAQRCLPVAEAHPRTARLQRAALHLVELHQSPQAAPRGQAVVRFHQVQETILTNLVLPKWYHPGQPNKLQ